MSQLERALRKARIARDADRRADPGESLAPPTPNAAFVSAWDFSEIREPAPPKPAPLPHVAPTGPAVAPIRPEAPPSPPQFAAAVREKLVVGPMARPDVREQFGKVAAILYQMRQAAGIKVVMIVSAVPGEGKTLTATNLALTLSESYHAKVLLVDADLRRPTLHQVFDVPNGVGLKEKLAAAESDSVSATPITPRLDLLTAGSGSADPMGLLISERMRNLIAKAAIERDWVVIDTPPVELLPDARVLASMVDVALLVVRAGSTRFELAQRTLETIGRDRVAGVVLNQMTEREALQEYRYYGYYGADTAQSAL